jgi:hypothetical protein
LAAALVAVVARERSAYHLGDRQRKTEQTHRESSRLSTRLIGDADRQLVARRAAPGDRRSL